MEKKKLQMELSSESLDREIILDYQGRLTIITRVLVRGRQEIRVDVQMEDRNCSDTRKGP